MIPFELQKTQTSAEVLCEQDADECANLCEMGTDPSKIKSCIGFCEQLVMTSVEL